MTPERTVIIEKQTADGKDIAVDLSSGRAAGTVVGLEALKQAIRFRLMTERGAFPIYSDNYGVPYAGLLKNTGYLYFIQLKNRITETLLEDSRVLDVYDFEFSRTGAGELSVSFRAATVYGEITEVSGL